MSRRTVSSVALSSLLVLSAFAARAHADGFIIVPRPPGPPQPRPVPHMPLEVKNHHVTTEIRDTVAVTAVDQVFHNPMGMQLEGEYMFPMPEGASVQKFSMWMDGKEVHGEILDAEKARATYEDIVRKTKDPALLEYIGSRLYRARVFPIPANGDVRVKLEYTEQIAVNGGLGVYRYPLNTEKFSARDIEDVTIAVSITSQVPLRNVFCPSHEADVSRRDDRTAKVGFEAHRVRPDRDFLVYIQAGEAQFGLSLLSYRSAGEDGFFMARIAPPAKSEGKALPKDVCFVLDTSGSMAGEKIEQARRAMKFCLNSLRPEDRFNIISFATDTRPFRDALVPAARETLDAALEAVREMKAAGGTDIQSALMQAIKSRPKTDADRPYMIVFITDGAPTVGERDPDRIRAVVRKANEGASRLFVFGVGHDLNTKLLDTLAEENRGTREYIDEKEDIELKVSRFFEKLAEPALCDIRLEFGGADVAQVYPKELPDLFHGGELVVIGRYRSAGSQRVKISGKRGSDNRSWEYPAEFASGRTDNDFLPRLWATRKIGYLMDEIRLRGETSELRDEITQLAKRYGIVTPYTSYLVVEEQKMARVAGKPVPASSMGRMLERAANQDHAFGDRLAAAPNEGRATAGAAGVNASKKAYALQAAPAAAAPAQQLQELGYLAGSGGNRGATQAPIRVVGAKTFFLDDGRWIDSRYDGKAETKKVKVFSDDYFRLLRENKEVGKYFALGARVVVVADGGVFETVE